MSSPRITCLISPTRDEYSLDNPLLTPLQKVYEVCSESIRFYVVQRERATPHRRRLRPPLNYSPLEAISFFQRVALPLLRAISKLGFWLVLFRLIFSTPSNLFICSIRQQSHVSGLYRVPTDLRYGILDTMRGEMGCVLYRGTRCSQIWTLTPRRPGVDWATDAPRPLAKGDTYKVLPRNRILVFHNSRLRHATLSEIGHFPDRPRRLVSIENRLSRKMIQNPLTYFEKGATMDNIKPKSKRTYELL